MAPRALRDMLAVGVDHLHAWGVGRAEAEELLRCSADHLLALREALFRKGGSGNGWFESVRPQPPVSS